MNGKLLHSHSRAELNVYYSSHVLTGRARTRYITLSVVLLSLARQCELCDMVGAIWQDILEKQRSYGYGRHSWQTIAMCYQWLCGVCRLSCGL